MKTALIFLAVTILLLALFWWKADIWFGSSTIDIHFNDTYYVVSHFQLVLFIILILGTFSSVGGVVGTRFSNKAFLFSFLFFLAIDVYICWNVYRSLHRS